MLGKMYKSQLTKPEVNITSSPSRNYFFGNLASPNVKYQIIFLISSRVVKATVVIFRNSSSLLDEDCHRLGLELMKKRLSLTIQ